MTNKIKPILEVAVLVFVVFLGFKVLHHSAASFGVVNQCASGQTCLPSLELTGPNGGVTNALQLDSGIFDNAGTLTQEGAASFLSTLGVTGTSTFSGASIFANGNRASYTNSTTTSASAESIFENDIAPGGNCYSTVSLKQVRTTPAPATTTLTYLATSTFANMIPNVGDSCVQRIESATSSASNPGIILAFGTGWKPQTSSTTPTGLTINGGAYAIVTYVRQFSSDIAALITIFKSAN